ncbi:hypothetical protein [Staphylococcus equorum]|uniref:hypothetical protein n=1 Tax=Staphylococcus equorum TaxID=246432 RepID=UPI00384B01A9
MKNKSPLKEFCMSFAEVRYQYGRFETHKEMVKTIDLFIKTNCTNEDTEAIIKLMELQELIFKDIEDEGEKFDEVSAKFETKESALDKYYGIEKEF